MDRLSPQKRSALMSRIGGKNTKPEILVRKLLHAAGYRFTLHDSKLPGKPDIILPKWKTTVFVQGCFWHGHRCRRGKLPASNKSFWEAKILSNKRRDKRTFRRLRTLGWKVVVVWECSLARMDILRPKLLRIGAIDA